MNRDAIRNSIPGVMQMDYDRALGNIRRQRDEADNKALAAGHTSSGSIPRNMTVSRRSSSSRHGDSKGVSGTLPMTGGMSSMGRSTTGSTAVSLNSAALQRDMARRFNLRPSLNLNRQGVRQAQSQAKDSYSSSRERSRGRGDMKDAYDDYGNHNGTSTNTRLPRRAEEKDVHYAQSKESEKEEVFVPDQLCASCSQLNPGRALTCTSCGYFLSGPPRPPPLSMAQKRGLLPIPAPISPVRQSAWQNIESRLIERGEGHCPICMEGFKGGGEVLLSCSHLFHLACLTSFENFMQRNEERSCPICRTPNYQKKITASGSKAYTVISIVKIQCLWRGYRSRRQFYIERKAFYSNNNNIGWRSEDGSIDTRRRFFEAELSNLSMNREKEERKRDAHLDSVVNSMDSVLQENRELDVLFEEMLAQRRENQFSMRYGAMMGPGSVHPFGNADEEDGSGVFGVEDNAYINEGMLASASQQYLHDNHVNRNDNERKGDDENTGITQVIISRERWIEAVQSARGRGLGDCAICMNGNRGIKSLVLLSCSHVFHSQCVANFERFLLHNKSRGCPVCRSNYLMKPVSSDHRLQILEDGYQDI